MAPASMIRINNHDANKYGIHYNDAYTNHYYHVIKQCMQHYWLHYTLCYFTLHPGN